MVPPLVGCFQMASHGLYRAPVPPEGVWFRVTNSVLSSVLVFSNGVTQVPPVPPASHCVG